jgi:hypothetical protein
MGQQFERVEGQLGAVLKTAATVVLLGLMVAAGERALAPLLLERPNDRTPADVRATNAVYYHMVSYATEPDTLRGARQDF